MDPDNSVSGHRVGGRENIFFIHQRISQRAVRTTPRGPIASRGGPVPAFLRKPCDFPGGSPQLDPRMSRGSDESGSGQH